MKNLGRITEPLDIVTKEYVDGKASTDMDDTGWIYPTINSEFAFYDTTNGTKVQYRRYGKIVWVYGQIKPTKAMAISTTLKELFTLPAGFRPSHDIISLHQGSNKTIWASRIETSGIVYVCRYRNDLLNNSTYPEVQASAWMPFSVIFMTD